MRTDVYQMKHYSNFKNELFGRQEGKCAGCGVCSLPQHYRRSHHPESKGGQDNEENLQLLRCLQLDECNRDIPTCWPN